MDRARGDQEQPSGSEEGEESEAAVGDQADPSEGDGYEGDPGADTAGEGGPDDEGLLGDGESPGQEEEFEHTPEQLDGTAAEEGMTRSEVIESAADEGFATTEYQDVYADYEDIAQEVMERDEVPDGYRYYIERYFQLIRPK